MDNEQVATAFRLSPDLLTEQTEHNLAVARQAVLTFSGDIKALADALVKVLAPMSTVISALEAFRLFVLRIYLHPHKYAQKRHAKWRMRGDGWSGRWYKCE